MSVQPLRLFDTADRPTTRQVADRIRVGGTAALTEAERRADAATYQEVSCRSALNRVQGMPFEWTLNPYRGCTHACHYCYARRYHTQFALGAGDDFSSVILVKRNIAQVLARELDRPAWTRSLVALGTATDPYQPIEGHYRLTRQCLEALASARTPVGLVTKGPMVVRDADVLAQVSAAASCTVYMSVPTVDEDAWRALEPGTAHPLQRLRAVRRLVDAGIDAGVLMAPIVPGFTSSRSSLERTIKAVADHGVPVVGCSVMRLEGGARDHFMAVIAREFPAMAARLERLYTDTSPPMTYRRELRGMVRALEARYGLVGRPEQAVESAHTGAGATAAVATGPAQAGFEWER